MYRIEITADTLTELAGKVMSLAVKLNGAAEPTQRAYAPPVEPVEINPVAPAPVADAPALSFDRDVAPVVLLAVATKGKPFVEAAMAEFLAKGGTIQQCAPFESGRAEGESFSSWGKPKKKPGEEPTIEPTEDDLLPG